jgi:hypothetical protein
MNPAQRQAAVAALDEAIDRFERAQTSADMEEAAARMLAGVEAGLPGAALFAPFMAHINARLIQRAGGQDPEQARQEMLPQLRAWRAQFAGGAAPAAFDAGSPLTPAPPSAPSPVPPPPPAPVRAPQNRPTRPGCSGGTAVLLLLALAPLAVVWLR